MAIFCNPIVTQYIFYTLLHRFSSEFSKGYRKFTILQTTKQSYERTMRLL